jgi:hypothetical protein
MKKNYWYEVFEVLPNNEGTKTINSFDTLKEARKERKKLIATKGYKSSKLHIDKWQIKNGCPQPVNELV